MECARDSVHGRLASWARGAFEGRCLADVLLVGTLLLALATPAVASPVLLEGGIGVTTTTECSPWCGTLSSADANIDADSTLVKGQFKGDAGGATSAVLGGGGWFGKAAAGTGTAEWWATVRAPADYDGDPFNLYFDWSLWLLSSHDALLGQAEGGAEMTVRWYQCRELMPWLGCISFLTFEQKRVYKDSVLVKDVWDLGQYDADTSFGRLQVTFTVASGATSLPIVGVYASAIDFATLGFTLSADDGTQPHPVPEPGGLSIVLAALGVLGLLRRRSMSTASH
ncbi:MAG TPA: hypothetical protein PKJ45_08360 [Rubrivivax sp.]|nr:hypothetical protein [Rubrivivax sp.]